MSKTGSIHEPAGLYYILKIAMKRGSWVKPTSLCKGNIYCGDIRKLRILKD